MATERRVSPTDGRTDGRKERIASQRFQTRMGLIQAARDVFETQGFMRARVSDIVKRAGVAHGTFYIYFDSKEHIFKEIASAVLGETLTTGTKKSGDDRDGADPVRVLDSIEAANRAYLLAYARNSKIMMLTEQVATLNEELMHIRHERFRAFVSRTERSILRMQAQGLADPDLDVHHTALALTGMASRMAQFAFIQHEDVDLEAMVDTLTKSWARVLNLDHHVPLPALPASTAEEG